MKCVWTAVLLLTCAAAAAGTTPAADHAASCIAAHYRVLELPLRPAALNEAGQVVGINGSHRAASWSARSGLRELPLPEGFVNSEAVSINARGDVLVNAYDRTFSMHQAYVWSDGKLNALGGRQTLGRRIADNGEVIGESVPPEKSTSEATLWSGGTPRLLNSCCGGSARDINRHGDVIGDVYDEAGRYHAYLWSKNGAERRIGPQERYSTSIALNGQGQALIQAFPDVLLDAGDTLTPLALSPKHQNHPRAMNDCGAIVGSFGPYSDAARAFLWEKSSGFLDLNTRIASGSDWTLEFAYAINQRGEIVGQGDFKDDDDRGFLLIPQR